MSYSVLPICIALGYKFHYAEIMLRIGYNIIEEVAGRLNKLLIMRRSFCCIVHRYVGCCLLSRQSETNISLSAAKKLFIKTLLHEFRGIRNMIEVFNFRHPVSECLSVYKLYASINHV